MSAKLELQVAQSLTDRDGTVSVGVLMSGLLVKKGKSLSTARHCALTRDCFVYSSAGEVRHVPVLNMQVSVARESFTLVDCSEEAFTFRCLGKTRRTESTRCRCGRAGSRGPATPRCWSAKAC
jgi:hypothetical protein